MLKLSVITATFRDPGGLARTLESLRPLSATNTHWELIIVDSSPEENESVLLKYGAAFPIVRKISPPKGIYAALNLGAETASGDLIWFLNGGDRLRSCDDLLILLRKFEQIPDLEMICCGADLFRDGNFLYSKIPHLEFLDNILGSNRICHQGVVSRRSIFLKIGLYDLNFKLAGDYDHLFRSYLEGAKILCLPIRLVEYDMSGSSSDYRRVFSEFKKVHRKHSSRLSYRIQALNEFARRRDYTQISVLKFFRDSPVAGLLRPLWLAWNRRSRIRPPQ